MWSNKNRWNKNSVIFKNSKNKVFYFLPFPLGIVFCRESFQPRSTNLFNETSGGGKIMNQHARWKLFALHASNTVDISKAKGIDGANFYN